jgi:hypothetical protein
MLILGRSGKRSTISATHADLEPSSPLSSRRSTSARLPPEPSPSDSQLARSQLESSTPTALHSGGCPEDIDPIWAKYEKQFGSQQAFSKHRESADLIGLAERARSALAWIAARPEREIVIVSHQAAARPYPPAPHLALP